MSAVLEPAVDRWNASLKLRYSCIGERTILRCRHAGPLRVQKPFYPPDGVCHTYLLHPPGGVVGSDRLHIDAEVNSGAAALVTTPAAMKIYRSSGPIAEIDNELSVRAGASLEWLPQDTIVFGGSRLRQTTRLRLQTGARYCGWEVTSLGRPASGDHYTSGTLDQRLDVYVDDELTLRERLVRDADTRPFSECWNLAGYRSFGTLVLFPGTAGTLERVQLLLRAMAAELSAATRLDGIVLVRALASDAVRLREDFAQIWRGIRQHTLRRPACAPRIWAT